MIITQAQADTILAADLVKFQKAVEDAVAVPLTDNQFAALVSFTFNVGSGAFRKSTLLKKLNRGDYQSVPKELMKWVHDNGKRVEGLVNRRSAECGLWAKGSFVSSNTVPATPKAPAIATVDNAVKVATGASGVLQAFTSGTAQIILASVIAAGVAFLVYRWYREQREQAT